MKLTRLYNNNSRDFLCDITLYIDGLSKTGFHNLIFCRHYLHIEDKYLKDGIIPICYPGIVIGKVYLDDENRIKNIEIGVNSYNRYPEDISDKLNKKFREKTIEINREDFK